jgi:inorganic pyrophosphatase
VERIGKKMKKIKAVIEMPMESIYKYEVDKYSGALRLDRPISEAVPYNYGFVPHTICKDGDPLDVFVLSRCHIPSLTEVEINIVGVLKCTDGGVSDDKLIGTLVGEECLWTDIEVTRAIEKIGYYLSVYKEGFVIDRYENAGQAVTTYELSRVWDNPAD